MRAPEECGSLLQAAGDGPMEAEIAGGVRLRYTVPLSGPKSRGSVGSVTLPSGLPRSSTTSSASVDSFLGSSIVASLCRYHASQSEMHSSRKALHCSTKG